MTGRIIRSAFTVVGALALAVAGSALARRIPALFALDRDADRYPEDWK